MNKYLLSTSILSAALLITPIAKAGSSESYVHNASIDISTKLSKGRKLAELNYMQPFFAGDNSLPIFDLKLKTDNHKSKEINLGLAYRHNLNDDVILGAYTYFDHRHTANNFSVSGLTAGVEFLSKYIDARANVYLPENKRKKIVHNSERSIEIKGNSIYALSGGHTYESSLRGYDIEVGTPLFAFSDELNESIGTKLYAGRYSFTAKGVQPINGTRFRITQDITKTYIGENSYNLYMNAETQYDKVRKRQNFVGVGLKVIFNDKQNQHKKKSGLDHRMMETIVRDVDIVTNSAQSAPEIHDLYIGNNKIKRVLYVGAADGHRGTGTKNNPLSFQQLNAVRHDDAAIIVTEISARQGGRNLNANEHAKIISDVNILNGKRTVLTTKAAKNHAPSAVTIHADSMNDIEVSSHDNSATHINVEGSKVSTKTPHGRRSTATLLRAAAHRVATQQVIINNLMNPANAGVGGAPRANAGAHQAGAANAGAGANAGAPAGAGPQAINQWVQAINRAVQSSHNAVVRAQNAANAQEAQNAAQEAQNAAQEATTAEQAAQNAIQQILNLDANPANDQIIAQALQNLNQVANNARNVEATTQNILKQRALNQAQAAKNRAQAYPNQNMILPNVTLADLTTEELKIYTLIADAVNLSVNDPNNLYVKRQAWHDDVMGIINHNPNANINEISNRINARQDLNQNVKADYIDIAERVLKYKNRDAAQNANHNPAMPDGQQGIGTDPKSIKDATSVDSLERLRHLYGILDGDFAANLARGFVIDKIKRDIDQPNAANADIINEALSRGNIEPTQRYKNAVIAYFAGGASAQEKNAAMAIIQDEVRTSHTAVNNSMAAYRALERLNYNPNDPVFRNRLFTDYVIGRYSAKEYFSYAVMAQLDVNEIQRSLRAANPNGAAPTPKGIFDRQRENIENLIKILGTGQRGYNMAETIDIDIGGVGNIIDGGTPLNRLAQDINTCAHGYAARIMDTTIGHSQVTIIDSNPQMFGLEFRQSVVTRFQNLQPAEKAAARRWIDQAPFDLTTNINNANRTVAFSGPAMPQSLSGILSDVIRGLNDTYRFTDPNPGRRLIQTHVALGIFPHFVYADFN